MTDFGFKKIFGQEESKNLLKSFLYEILKLNNPIKDITYLPMEQLPETKYERVSVFDLFCVDEKGNRFLVEMQRARQTNFKERMIYYSTFLIAKQAERGAGWKYDLDAVYCIGILNFSMSLNGHYLNLVKLKNDETNKVFYEKLTYVFIELEKFNKQLHELQTPTDKWIYLLKHLAEFCEVPQELSDSYLSKAFDLAKLAALEPKELDMYETSLKVARDNYNALTTARAEGKAEGRIEEKTKIALSMLNKNMDVNMVSELTGLSKEEIRHLEK
jgi:predicted transposase/invertase (TIGR01784 family)